MRQTKQGHQTIARMLVDLSTPSEDDIIQDVPHGVDGVAHALGVHVFRERCIAGKIGYQHRKLVPLLVARFRIENSQSFTQYEQRHVNRLARIPVLTGRFTSRFQRGNRLNQSLTANVCLAHTNYYINSGVRTRTAPIRDGWGGNVGDQ